MSALSKQRLTVTDKRNELASNPYTGADKRHTEDQPDECVCVCVYITATHWSQWWILFWDVMIW